MTKDPRKNLELSYNSLNLLSEVRQSSILKAKYVYAADGTKLAVSDASNNGYDYRGSLIYKNTSGKKSLESVSFSDGRITKTNSTYVPNYYLTDHLGSVRVIFDASGGVLEQNDYYAFGEKHENRSLYGSNNRFKYNGKELQTTGDLGLLDYGTRMCDNELGRWFVQDPAEQFSSPYNFCGNNPIVFVDPNGMLSDWYQNDFGTTFWADSQDPTYQFRGEDFKNIGHSLSIWDDNLMMFLNYYQNQFLGMSKAKLNIHRYISRNNGVIGGLLNERSDLDNKYKIDLMIYVYTTGAFEIHGK